MINHIVLFKLKEHSSKKMANALYSNFLTMKDKIPGIISITGGFNMSIEEKNKGYDIAFIITFKSTKDRDNYLSHSRHQWLIEKHILPLIDDALVFDYEIKK